MKTKSKFLPLTAALAIGACEPANICPQYVELDPVYVGNGGYVRTIHDIPGENVIRVVYSEELKEQLQAIGQDAMVYGSERSNAIFEKMRLECEVD